MSFLEDEKNFLRHHKLTPAFGTADVQAIIDWLQSYCLKQERPLKPIADVHERFKHLDAILSHQPTLDATVGIFQTNILHDLWIAILSSKEESDAR